MAHELIDRKGELLGTIWFVSPGERCWAETDHSAPIRFEATPAFEGYRELLAGMVRAPNDRLRAQIRKAMRIRDSRGVWEFISLGISSDCGFIRAPNVRRCQWNGSEWV